MKNYDNAKHINLELKTKIIIMPNCIVKLHNWIQQKMISYKINQIGTTLRMKQNWPLKWIFTKRIASYGQKLSEENA